MSQITTKVGLDNLLDEQVNPATEETLQAVLAASGGVTYNYIQKDEGATYIYYGFASSTGWKFKRKTVANGIWQIASGLGDYNTEWPNRASKTYNNT